MRKISLFSDPFSRKQLTKTLILIKIIILIKWIKMETRTKGISKINKHPKANTMYLTIPADIVKEKNFPFKSGEKVKLELDKKQQIIIISKFE